MTIPLSPSELKAYNNVPTTPLSQKLGDTINALSGASQLSPFDAALREVYVNTATGNDDNDGSVGSPLKTVQAAVDRFKPAWLGPQTWNLGDDRLIFVQAGSSIEESITIPAHNGEGALIIRGEEQVLYSGLEEVGFSAIAGTSAQQTLSFVGTPLTPASLTFGAFVVPRTNLLDNIFEFQWDNLPITNGGNTNSAVPVIASDPGVYTAFSHVPGAIVDIVEPQINWNPGEYATGAFYEDACIRNQGGALVVQGFFWYDAANPFRTFTVIINNGSSSKQNTGSTVCVSRCSTLTPLITLCSNSQGVSFSGNVFSTSSASFSSIELVNNFFKGLVFRSCFTGSFGSFSQGVMNFNTNSYAYWTGADCSGGVYVFSNTRLSLESATIINAIGPLAALEIAQNSFVELLGFPYVDGSSGNLNVGARIGTLSAISGDSTLTGTGGELQVGALAPQLWAAGPTTDPTKLARYEG